MKISKLSEQDPKYFVKVDWEHGQDGTHYVCNDRLKKEGGEAKCCGCNPHRGCKA